MGISLQAISDNRAFCFARPARIFGEGFFTRFSGLELDLTDKKHW